MPHKSTTRLVVFCNASALSETPHPSYRVPTWEEARNPQTRSMVMDCLPLPISNLPEIGTLSRGPHRQQPMRAPK
jgi:hypothetical protein